MKKHLLILSCMALLGLWSCGGTSVDEETPGGGTEKPGPDVPDPENPDLFTTYLLQYFDTDGDGEISTMEADAVTHIDCTDRKITALTNIEMFRNLTHLTCAYNKITSLNLSRNTALLSVDCRVNEIAQLNVSGCPLLESIICNRNALTSLNLAANSRLTHLDCAENKILTLDVSANLALVYLDCMSNGMTEVALSRGQTIPTIKKDATTSIQYKDMPTDAFQLFLLEQFDTNGDKALSDTEANAVTEIDCSGREFSSLGGLELLVKLQRLNCSGCSLSSLDVTGGLALTDLNCSNNTLSMLDVSKNRSLATLDCRQNAIPELWLEWTQVIKTCNKDSSTKIRFYNKPRLFYFCDWYDNGEGLRGIVCNVGSPQKILALERSHSMGWSGAGYDVKVGTLSTTDGAFNMDKARNHPLFEKLTIFKYAADYGDGWFPLAKDEVDWIAGKIASINKALIAYGGEPIPTGTQCVDGLWSSTESGAVNSAWKFTYFTGMYYGDWKENSKWDDIGLVLLGHTF